MEGVGADAGLPADNQVSAKYSLNAFRISSASMRSRGAFMSLPVLTA